MRFRTELLGDHIALRKGLSYKGEYLVEESSLGLVGLDAFVAGGGYKPGAEKPYSGAFKPDHLVESGDVLLAMTEQQDGLLASPLVVPENLGGYEELVLSHHVAKVVAKSGRLRPEFVFNFLRVPINRARAAYGNTGTTVQDLPYDVIYEQMIPVPSIEEQDRINSFIAVLDHKIELNNAIAVNVERIAQSIFRSWFLDFDPVKAKMAGEKPAGMDDVTAALFSDSMEDSELGPIPRGWRVGTVGEICSVLVNGSTPSRSNSSFWDASEVSWFKTGELSDGFLLESKESISESALTGSNVKILPKGGVLMAIYAAPTVGRLGILTHDSTFNQACTGMLARKEYGLPFLFLHLKNRRNWFNSFAIGAAQQNISKSIVEKCPVVISSEDIHEAFLATAGPLFAEIECLTRQSEELANLRDALLPRLISGELQIPEEMLDS